MVSPVKDDEFSERVLKSPLPVIVDFWAPWCGPCRALAPVLAEVAEALKDQAVILSMNVDENPDTPSNEGIMSIPTLILFVGGKRVDTKIGIHTKETLIAWVEPHTGGA